MRNCLLFVIGCCCAGAVSAQNFPNRPVRMLIPFTAGSAADVIARAMEPAMRERLGQSLVIDNCGGADGYTVLMGTIGTPEEFRKLIEAEIPKWAQVVKASGAKVD